MEIKRNANETNRKPINQDIKLTERELDVLQSIVQGLTNIEIATELNISKYTVSAHRKQMISKFKAKNSCQLVYLACTYGVV